MLKSAHLPPTKCRPLKNFTSGFGAVKLTKISGSKPIPGPSVGGPFSISQDEGASMEVTGILVSASAAMMDGNGSRISPENEKPKMASIMWSVSWRARGKSVVKGTERC